MSGSICGGGLCQNCPSSCRNFALSRNTCCDNFDSLRDFAVEFVQAGDARDEEQQFSLVRFATDATTLQELGPAANVITALNNLDYTGGWTNTGDAISFCDTSLSGPTNDDVEEIIVLLTDGTPTAGDASPPPQTGNETIAREWATTQATAAKLAGNTIITVFINSGNDADAAFLETLSSGPEFAITVNDFSDLDNLLDDLLNAINCV
jgi:hypothetical protein